MAVWKIHRLQPAWLRAEGKCHKAHGDLRTKGNIWMTFDNRKMEGRRITGKNTPLKTTVCPPLLPTTSPPLSCSLSLSVYRWLSHYFWPWLNETENSAPIESFLGVCEGGGGAISTLPITCIHYRLTRAHLHQALTSNLAGWLTGFLLQWN